MKNVERIKPNGLFTNYIFKAIPLAFDESLSYYETLCGLLSYLKDTVLPTVNNNADAIIEIQKLMTELQNYVDNYFNNLDVQNEINNKLDNMVATGQLQTILDKYINKINEIVNYTRQFSNILPIKDLNNTNNPLYCHLQAIYDVGDGNMIISRSDVDETITTARIDIVNKITGEILRTITGDFNSANDIAFDEVNKIIYVCSGRGSMKITSINYETLETIKVYELDYYPQMLAWNHDKNVLIVAQRVNGIVTYYNVGDDLTINEQYTLNNKEYMANGGETIDYINNMLIYNNIKPNRLVIYDATTHNFIKEILLEQFSVDKFNIGEFQSANLKSDGSLYIGSDLWLGSQSNESLIQVFKTNINKNNTNYIDNQNVIFYTSQINNNIYVDNKNTNSNPTGLESNPFRSINEALSYIENLNQCFIINVKSSDTKYNAFYLSSKNIMLIQNYGSNRPIINGVTNIRNGNITLQNLIFENNNNNYCLNCTYSNIKSINCDYNVSETATLSPLYFSNSDVLLHNPNTNFKGILAQSNYSSIKSFTELITKSTNYESDTVSYLFNDSNPISCIDKPSVNYYKDINITDRGLFQYVNVMYRSISDPTWHIEKMIYRKDITITANNVSGNTSTGNTLDTYEATITFNDNNIEITNYTSTLETSQGNNILIRKIWLSNF